MEITGRLTANAEVRKAKGDKKVTGFTIAMNRSYMKDGERVEISKYVDCSYWINSGVADFLKKGALVLLYGDMDVNAWIDKEGNAKGRLIFHTQIIKILAFAGKKEDEKDDEKTNSDKPNAGKNNAKKAIANGASEEDDLPF